MQKIARLGVADVLERVRVSTDAATAGEEQTEFPAFQLQNRSGCGQPACAGGGNIRRIVQALQDAVVLEVDSVRRLRKPEVGDVIVYRGAEGIGGVVVCPEGIALLRCGKSSFAGVIAAEDFLLVDNLQRPASGNDAKNTVRIEQAGGMERQF